LSVFPWPIIFKPEKKTAYVIWKYNSKNVTTYRINIAECQTTSTCAPFLSSKHFYFIVSSLKIIGHGNPDNNLESLCIIISYNTSGFISIGHHKFFSQPAASIRSLNATFRRPDMMEVDKYARNAGLEFWSEEIIRPRVFRHIIIAPLNTDDI
jgi:hypothetical protein